YERPVFLWGREGNGSIKGSVRSGGGIHALELMRATENTFVECGGHAAAGGFTVRDDAIFFLEDRLVLALRSLGEEGSQDTLEMHADAEVAPEELHATFLTKIEKLAPFGQQNPKPVFLLRGIVVQNISHFGKGEEHLKLKISSAEKNQSIDAVTFFVKGALARSANACTQGSRADILAHLERDTFSRGNPVRLRLLDLRLV
ncbi:MAG: DHHA1 domain-containing protein, partial [Candidatus Kaiserbacteria bacterium]|nr:DHHA1 domain-containing protein [Candidatus Kaiserbacteria bacterium]